MRCQICGKECKTLYSSKMEMWIDGKLKELKADLCKECLQFWAKEDFSEFGVYSKTYPSGIVDEHENS